MRVLSRLATDPRTMLEKEMEKACLVAPVTESIVLARVFGGDVLMYLDLRDRDVAPHLALEGYWEFWVTRFLAERLQKQWTCVDVGANFGYYTALFSKLTSGVLAVEPAPRTAALLASTLAVNGMQNVVLVEEAAWSSTEKLTLLFEATHFGATRTRSMPDAKMLAVPFVQARPLDLLIRKADLIKIDAEGAEYEIWKGMSKLRAQPDVKILLEWTRSAYTEETACAFANEMLASFRVGRVTTESTLEPMTAETLLGLDEVEMLWLER